jgi:hypothetical protein
MFPFILLRLMMRMLHLHLLLSFHWSLQLPHPIVFHLLRYDSWEFFRAFVRGATFRSGYGSEIDFEKSCNSRLFRRVYKYQFTFHLANSFFSLFLLIFFRFQSANKCAYCSMALGPNVCSVYIFVISLCYLRSFVVECLFLIYLRCM